MRRRDETGNITVFVIAAEHLHTRPQNGVGDQVGRKEEALETLFSVLQKDLAFGDARKMFLDVIATLPDGDELAGKYRRKLYSILY